MAKTLFALLAVTILVAGSQALNIVQLAQATPDLSTLVTALQAGGLVQTLSGPGPFTVFAPTNEAFALLPASVLNYLLQPENKRELVGVLTYHVTTGNVSSSDLTDHEEIKTVQGSHVQVFITPEKTVYINQAQVIAANVEASNGVVHLINQVLIPSNQMARLMTLSIVAPTQNIVQIAQATPDLSTLVTALTAGGLVDTLSSRGPFTVFAPTNEAFNKLPASLVTYLLQPENKAELVNILTYHVANGNTSSYQLFDHMRIQTVQGSTVTVFVTPEKTVFINQAQVIAANIEASNGVVHLIDQVVVPGPKMAVLLSKAQARKP